MATDTLTTKEFTPNTGSLRFAFDFLEDELETLLALSITLMNRLEPGDPKNPSDSDDITSWRLSQVLNDRLAKVEFSNNMRMLMLGSADVCNSSAERSHA